MNKVLSRFVYLIPALILGCSSAEGDTTITVSWDLPVVYCDGSVLTPATDLLAVEVYISASTIPASEDPGCGGVRDVPPVGITPLSVTGTATSVQATLTPGITYHIRARVQASNGEWSNLTPELQKVVANLEPGIMQNFRLN